MNSLEEKYNLIEQTPLERLLENPTANNLKDIPKSSQTLDLLIKVCEKDGNALRYASKRLITPRLCEIAVNQNGEALAFVPDNVFENVIKYGRDEDWAIKLYNSALKTDGRALRFIPDELIDEKIVKHAIEVESGKDYTWGTYPIAYVPKKYRTHEINVLSVTCSPFSIKDISDMRKDYAELAQIAVSKNGAAIEYISKKYLSKDLYIIAVNNNSEAIKFLPQEYITKEISENCFSNNYELFSYIPAQYITEKMCIQLIKEDHFSVFQRLVFRSLEDGKIHEPITFIHFPEKMRNCKKIIDNIIEKDKRNANGLLIWNEKIIKEIQERDKDNPRVNIRGEIVKPLKRNILEYINKKSEEIKEAQEKSITPIKIDVEKRNSLKEISMDLPDEYSLVPMKTNDVIVHDLSDFEYSSEKMYYITDIHVDYQIRDEYNAAITNDHLGDIESRILLIDMIDKKISAMINDKENIKGTLLIGGDVANNIQLAELFYQRLCMQWHGKIIVILGNHELWDGIDDDKFNDPYFHQRSVEDIVNDYREKILEGTKRIYTSSLFFLENEVFVKYKNKRILTLTTDDLNNTSEEELREFFSKCTLIILGGIGYSGLNPFYNAEHIMYNKNIDLNEDKRRAKIFKKLHDKVARCATDKKVIVLSHTPVFDWMPEDKCVPGWVYVNGHTHRNALNRHENGAVVLADNQVGYAPKTWKLNSIQLDYWYDPFEKYSDGTYKITSDQYKEFHLGRGISSNGCNYPGTLYMLKKSGLYMFLLEDIDYYYDNMDLYGEKIREIIKPYQNAMENLSKEVRRFGGTGYIHGCIVDISYFSHIYVNPYDGKVTPYWALDITGRRVYKDVKTLLISKEPELAKRFELSSKKESYPLLDSATSKKNSLAKIPDWVLGTDIYTESRIMKSIQYVWQHNIIRIWNDKVFSKNDIKPKKIEKISEENNIKTSTQNSIRQRAPTQYTVSKEVSDLFVGKEKVMKNGKRATITAYYTRWDITVQFEDGRVEEHRTIFEFNKGNID